MCVMGADQVQIKGQEAILEGDLFDDIATEDSSWTMRRCIIPTLLMVEDDVLTFELEKLSHVHSL